MSAQLFPRNANALVWVSIAGLGLLLFGIVAWARELPRKSQA